MLRTTYGSDAAEAGPGVPHAVGHGSQALASEVSPRAVQGFPRPRFLRVQASQDDEVSQDDEGRLQGQALQARCPPVNEKPIRAKFIEPNRTGGHRAPRTRVSQEVALLTSPAVFFTTQGFPRPRFPRPFQPNMRNF